MALNTITLTLFIIIVVDLYKFLLLFNQVPVIILIKKQHPTHYCYVYVCFESY
jgi:hypothetical protein